MGLSPIRIDGDKAFCTRCGVELTGDDEGAIYAHDGEEGRPGCFPIPKAEITPEQYGRLRRALDTIGDIQVSVLKDKGDESQWRRLYQVRVGLGQYLSDQHDILPMDAQLEQIRHYLESKAAEESLTQRLNDAIHENYRHDQERWKQICESEVFQDLKHGRFRHVLYLLANQQISVGKCAEAIAEIAHGVSPQLPEYEVKEESA